MNGASVLDIILFVFSGMSAVAGWMAALLIRNALARIDMAVAAIGALSERTVRNETRIELAEREIGILRDARHDLAAQVQALLLRGKLDKQASAAVE